MRLTFAPFGVTSYVFGVTSITLKDYMLGNLSYVFNCCSQCFIGCSIYHAANSTPAHVDSTKVTFIIEIALTIVVTIIIGIIAKNILETKLKEQE